MHSLKFFLFPALILATLVGCENKNSPRSATEPEVAQVEVAVEEPPAPRLLPVPPGEAGPFLIRIAESMPNRIFGAAASPTQIAVGFQADAHDVSLCPETELPICFNGYALVADRTNPNQPVIVKLYESDTQSGTQIDDLAESGGKFVFALNEGLYVGDTRKTTVVIVDNMGRVERSLDISQPGMRLVQSALADIGEGKVLLCRGLNSEDDRVKSASRIECELLDVQLGTRSLVGSFEEKSPIRAVSVNSREGKTLIVWVASGQASAVFLDHPENKMDLGAATADRPLIAGGLDDFAVAWQGDDGNMRIDRIPREGNERKSLILNGVRHRSINGMAAVSKGYLFAFRHLNTPQMGLVPVDFDGWHLVEDTQGWRMFTGYGSLEVQGAGMGRLIWQTAESLVEEK